MKRLIIHIGYPKTASSTLQKSVFPHLEEVGQVNFLGTFQRRFGGPLEQGFLFSRLVRNAVKDRLEGGIPYDVEKLTKASVGNDAHKEFARNQGYFSELLSNSVSNVYSCEHILIPYRRAVDYNTIPARFREMFDDGAVDFRIVVTLRRQDKLIESLYAQLFDRLMRYRSCRNIDKLIFDNNGLNTKSEYVSFFDFPQMIGPWIAEFGKQKVSVLLFEDMVQDKAGFAEAFREVLAIDGAVFLDAMRQPSRNTRSKNRRGQYLRKATLLDLLTYRNLLPEAFTASLPKTLRYALSIPVWVPVPGLSASSAQVLREHFQDSNAQLAASGLVDLDKLVRYGYCEGGLSTGCSEVAVKE